MRDEPPRPGLVLQMSATVWLIVINFAIYFLQLLFPLMTAGRGQPGVLLENYFALHPTELVHGQVWRLLAFQFLHGGPGHLLINCLMLYMFGRQLEADWGRRRYVWFYLAAGTVGGLLQAGSQLALPAHFGGGATVGASAGVFGLIAAFAMLNWNRPLNLLVAFVLPVTIKAKWLLLVEAVLAIFGLLRPDGIAHAAHAGGLLTGVVYVRYIRSGLWSIPRRRRSVSRESEQGPRWAERPTRPAKPALEVLSDEDFISRQVDPILEKISAHGIQSLTPEEKRILETAGQRMKLR